MDKIEQKIVSNYKLSQNNKKKLIDDLVWFNFDIEKKIAYVWISLVLI